MLKTNLTGGRRRSSRSTSPQPSRQPKPNASALQKISPNTSGMSAERERVRAAAEVEVDDAALGDRERDRDRPPRQVWIGERRQAMDRAEVQRHGGRRSRGHSAPRPAADCGHGPAPPQARGRFGLWFGGGFGSHPAMRRRRLAGSPSRKHRPNRTKVEHCVRRSAISSRCDRGARGEVRSGARREARNSLCPCRVRSPSFSRFCRQNAVRGDPVSAPRCAIRSVHQFSTPRRARTLRGTGASRRHRRIVGERRRRRTAPQPAIKLRRPGHHGPRGTRGGPQAPRHVHRLDRPARPAPPRLRGRRQLRRRGAGRPLRRRSRSRSTPTTRSPSSTTAAGSRSRSWRRSSARPSRSC